MIASELDISPSTVSREVKRNSNSDGEYVWCNAQTKSDARKHGLKGNHRKPDELWWRIEQMIIDEDWSPSQIAGSFARRGSIYASRPSTTTCTPTAQADSRHTCRIRSNTPGESSRYGLQKPRT